MIDDIITDVMKAEGWDTYTNHPNDRGGPTKWGITLNAWSEWRGRDVDANDVKSITEAQAREFYETEYVIAPRFHQLPEMVRAMVIDCGVNHGPRAASKWVQRAIGVKQDGILGPISIQTALECNPIAIHLKVSASRVKLFGRIVTKDPTQAVFAHGWNNRAAKWLERLAQSLTGG